MSELGRIVAEVQSLGVKVGPEVQSRNGGAGPAEGGALLLQGLPVNAPTQSAFVQGSPYSLRDANGRTELCKAGRPILPAEAPGRPRFYRRSTDQGVPYHHIGLMHGSDCLASTVLQTCAFWDTLGRCAFCGIELSLRAGRTIARKTPAQLAEVAVAAKELDGVRHVVLTTGTGNPPGSELDLLAACAEAVKAASGLPVHVQFMPPPDLDGLNRLAGSGVDTVGIHIESFDQKTLGRLAPPKASLGLEYFRAAWRKAVELFGPNQVSSFLIAGLGERRRSLPEGCRFLADMGVYPFLVPHRPIPGSRLADCSPPPPAMMNELYEEASAILAERGLSAGQSKAGCVRCGACSALAAWEKPPRELICLPARSRAEERVAFAVRRQVFVSEQRLFDGNDQDENDPRSIHLVALKRGEVVGTVRVFPVSGEEGHWIGGRLAVIRRERASGAGELLVREAMRTVKRRACARFTATIQKRNVIWFEKLGWRREGELFDLLGQPHQLMVADLDSV